MEQAHHLQPVLVLLIVGIIAIGVMRTQYWMKRQQTRELEESLPSQLAVGASSLST